MSLLSLSLSLVLRSEEKHARSAFLFFEVKISKKGSQKRVKNTQRERLEKKETRVLIRETTTGNNSNNGDFTIMSSLKKIRFFGWRRDMHLLLLSLSLCVSLSSLRESLFFKRDERRLRAAARVERDWRFFFGD